MSNSITQALHDLFIKQAVEATDLAIKANKYECAALISKDRAEWDLAASYYWQVGKKAEALFCERQANKR
jgi:hypothetical protein